METNDFSANASGGTELMLRRLHESIDPELLKHFQIIPSRVRQLLPDKLRILYAHDLPWDPESDKALANGGWRNFHQMVFVSHWQMQGYINRYQIPWSRCVVIQNSIVPIARSLPWSIEAGQTIRLVYHTTPHRGLKILVPVFEKLAAKHLNIHLDVFSSFGLYGWPHRDEPFKPLFEQIKAHPRMTYHGIVSNDKIRDALKTAHVFAYPSIWMETSCLCLIEAMSAGLVCVHPNYGALPETSASLTSMYQWQEDPGAHAAVFHDMLERHLQHINSQGTRLQIANQKAYADVLYNWSARRRQWEDLLRAMLK